MPVDLDNSSTVSGGDASVSSTGNQNPPPKKKRSLPGMPDPDAEVIALSPKTLMATNRFVCEICNKGFQRDQNLQLHRRGHNLPWKLRQRSSKEVRKRVYVCPVSGCVQRVIRARNAQRVMLSKICGTNEYRCDCGTLFYRRDSFITHRAFCDELAKKNHTQSNKLCPETVIEKNHSESQQKSPAAIDSSSPSPPPVSPAVSVETEPANIVFSSVLPIQNSSDGPENNTLEVIMEEEAPRTIGLNESNDHSNNDKSVYAGLFASSSTASPSLYAVSSTPSPSIFPPSLCAREMTREAERVLFFFV